MRFAPVILVILIAAAGCGHKKPQRTARTAPIPRPIGSTETGLASWYGHPYHGRQAADGETYDMETLVAAHRTLPFNTWLRVKNLQNDKTVDVRIIDRGPFVDGRIIDLSHAAAKAIDMIGPGVVKVRLEVIKPPAVMEANIFAVQVGAFRTKETADRIRSDMEKRYGTARLVYREGNPSVWRVLVGNEPTEERAGQLADRIRSENAEHRAAFVVRWDTPAGPTD